MVEYRYSPEGHILKTASGKRLKRKGKPLSDAHRKAISEGMKKSAKVKAAAKKRAKARKSSKKK